MKKLRSENGFTLIEILLIIIIVSIAIPALLMLLGQGAKQGVNAEIQVSATELAQALMEEIKTKCWDESKIVAGACTGTATPSTIQADGEAWNINHTNYDDVDDYDNLYANSGNADSVSIGGTSYSRDVQVCYVQPGDLNNTTPCVKSPPVSPLDNNYKRIKVTVSNSIIGSVDVVTIVTNY